MTFDYAAAPKERQKACNLCGWAIFEDHADRDRYGLPVQSVRCRGCGLVFIDPRMTPAGYEQFYSTGTYRKLLSEFYGKPVTASSIQPEQENYAEALALHLEPNLTHRQPKGLLDVGGSTGVVAEVLNRRFGIRGTVLEPSKAEREQAAKRGLETIPGTIEGFTPNGHRWDLVLLCQTVDHLMDITGTLAKLRRIVSGRGLFFMDIVNFDRTRTVKVDHPFNLSTEHAVSYLDRAGFKVLKRIDPLWKPEKVGFICAPKGGG